MRRPIKPFTVEVKRLRTPRSAGEPPPAKVADVTKVPRELPKAVTQAGIASPPPRRILQSLAPEPEAFVQVDAEVIDEVVEDIAYVALRPVKRKPVRQKTVAAAKPALKPAAQLAPVAKPTQLAPVVKPAPVAKVAPVTKPAPVAKLPSLAPVEPVAVAVGRKPERRDESAPLPRSERWKRRLPKILW